ncbi:MAG: hypothetical protein AB1758_25880 [Candidatus Eremiobacterota bacterium]
MKADCSIKDTLHGYILLPRLERLLVDSPWFQRLRHVKQNDVTSVVYPTVQTTRFEHSLGAMHLSRACMTAALENDEAATTRFCEILRADVARHRLAEDLKIEQAELLAIDLASLCGLLHDLGHPPLSHLMEQCLEYSDIYPGRAAEPAWHELNGADILRGELGGLVTDPHDRALLGLVADILSEVELGPALDAVGKLVNAVVDSDRMDFVMRDGRTSGSDFGQYDVERIVRSFQIVVDQPVIHIRPASSALSAIEALLQERYKVYRWVHFHSRVMQANACVRYALREVAEEAAPGVRLDPEWFQTEQYFRPSGTPNPALFLDDRFAWGLLEQALLSLDSMNNRDLRQERLLRVLKSLLLRERWATPLWKRLDEFQRFGNMVSSALGDLKTRPQLSGLGCPGNLFADSFLAAPRAPALVALREHLSFPGQDRPWYLVELTHGLKLKSQDQVIVKGRSGPQAVPLGDLSRTSDGIARAWAQDVHLHVFRLGPTSEAVDAADRQPLEAACEEVSREMAALYRDDLTVRQALDGYLASRGG